MNATNSSGPGPHPSVFRSVLAAYRRAKAAGMVGDAEYEAATLWARDRLAHAILSQDGAKGPASIRKRPWTPFT